MGSLALKKTNAFKNKGKVLKASKEDATSTGIKVKSSIGSTGIGPKKKRLHNKQKAG